MKQIKIRKTLCSRFIVTSYISIVVSVVLISVITYIMLGQNSWKYMVQTNKQVVLQKKSSIEMRLEALERTFRDVAYDAQVQDLLIQSKMDGKEDLNLTRVRMNQAITGVTNSLTMLDNMAVFSEEGDMVGSLLGMDTEKKAEEYSWYEKASLSGGETCWLDENVRMVWDKFGGHLVMPVVKKIRALHSGNTVVIGENLGYFYGILNLDQVLNFIQIEYPVYRRQVFIVNEQGEVISGGKEREICECFEKDLFKEENNNTYINYAGENVLFTYEKVPFDTFSWYLVCITPKSEILKDAHMAVAVCVLVSSVLLLVFLFFSIHNARAISQPFKILEEEFEKVEEGDFQVSKQKCFHILEIDRLFDRFHTMVNRLDRLIREVYEARIKEEKLLRDAREAEIQALQMQINPHFLYNTLDSINWMALMQGNKEISKMALALGHLFRANMNTTGIYTTVKEELENVRLFMYLEQVRFGEKLEYEIDANEDVMQAQIIKHIIQPFVENSIKHGIEPYHINGIIRICVRKEKSFYHNSDTDREERLEIIVSNNGRGMEAEKQREIMELWDKICSDKILEEEEISKKHGVGIRNIMMRLHLCYGKMAMFSIKSDINEGTVTQISFPMK